MKDLTKQKRYFEMNYLFPDELFRDIPNHTGYRVSNYGRMISCVGRGQRILKQSNGSHGYKVLKLGVGQVYSVARITATVFISNPLNKPEINHRNGIRHDNRIENLEWCTHKENMIHSVKTGLRKYENIKKSKNLTRKEINEIFNYRQYNISIKLLAKHYKRSPTTISQVLRAVSYKDITSVLKQKLINNTL